MFDFNAVTSRRNALRWLTSGAALATALPFVGTSSRVFDATSTEGSGTMPPIPDDVGTFPFALPELSYAYDAVGAAVDAETMEIHHTRHHQSYVNNLNDALKDRAELHDVPLTEMLAALDDLPATIRTTVRNNGGGHLNHSMFWDMLSPDGGGSPEGEIADAIDASFGDLTAFKEAFQEAAGGIFGSGWGWLVSDPNGALAIVRTANQDSPVMNGLRPLLGVDVWEHAYYLRYRQDRGGYLANFWKLVNWSAVNERYTREG